jgi:hypothetical protein
VSISGTVNPAARGAYAVSYRVADASGNTASAVRSVSVSDTLAPSIALNGAAAMKLECGVDSYSELSATAADACSGNLTGAIVKSGAVNAAAVGTYPVSYSVTDAAGLSASAVRTVNVSDTKAPVITLVGAASMSVSRGGTFTDPGATAADACSGNLTSAIVKSGTVNTAEAGTYTLSYQVQDGSGLSASVTRTVTVADSCNTVVNVKPTQLIWPPNHKYRSFTLSDCASVTSSCGSGGGCGHGAIDTMGTILSIYSDEAEDATGNGDGSTVNDIVITGKSSFKVRAERQGKGNGRVYGVNFKVTDTSGAVQTATCKFVVRHGPSGRDFSGDGAAAGCTGGSPY